MLLKISFFILIIFSFQCFAQEGENDFIEMDQKDLAELERAKKTQQKGYEAIATPVTAPLEKLQEIGHDTFTAASLMDDKVRKALLDVIEKGGLDTINPIELQDNMKKTPIGPLVERFPNVFTAMTKVLRDKNSMRQLIKLFDQKESAKTYGLILLGFFVLFIFLKTKIVKPTWGFMKRFFWNATLNLGYLVFNLGFCYYWFYKYLSPAVATFIKAL